MLTPWMYRRWRFDYPAELHPAVIERLRGTPARATALAEGEPAARLVWRPGDGWSAQRHLGHLADLEALLWSRLDAYERGDAVLPAADMRNAATVDADHDDRPIGEVLELVQRRRAETVERVSAYPRDFFARSAWHERLGIQKRVVDTLTFFADHDDHHFALARLVLSRAP